MLKCAIARSKKVISRKKNRLKKARVDFRVQTKSNVVKTNQLQSTAEGVSLVLGYDLGHQWVWANVRDEVEPERRHKCSFVLSICRCDTESASFNHGKTDPETTIGRKRSSTKSIYRIKGKSMKYMML